jgi:hypothetical protein
MLADDQGRCKLQCSGQNAHKNMLRIYTLAKKQENAPGRETEEYPGQNAMAPSNRHVTYVHT